MRLASNVTSRANAIPGRGANSGGTSLDAYQAAGRKRIISTDPWNKRITATHLQLKTLFQRDGLEIARIRRKESSMSMPTAISAETTSKVCNIGFPMPNNTFPIMATQHIRGAVRLLAILLFAATAHAQTYYKVANENDTIVTPTAISVRYGSGSSWVMATETGTFTASNATFGDPIPGTAKELDVLETATPQTMTVNGTSVTVPALVSTQTATPAPTTTTTATTYPIPIPALTAPLPAVVDPGMSCPIVGKVAKCPARTLLNASQTTTAPSSTSIPAKWNISCPVALVNGVPDLTQPLQCTITAAK